MKRIVLILFVTSFFVSCGTTGNIKLYNFNASKYEVEQELNHTIDIGSEHAVPRKWEAIYKNPGPIDYIYVYFSNMPEEMYQISFLGDSTEWKNSSNCRLGLVGLFNGDHWEYRKELSYTEMKRIQERFEKEILSIMKYSYKAD